MAGQAILYAAQSPLSKGQLALNNRIFAASQFYFDSAYVDKVLTAAQTLKFMAHMQRKVNAVAPRYELLATSTGMKEKIKNKPSPSLNLSNDARLAKDAAVKARLRWPSETKAEREQQAIRQTDRTRNRENADADMEFKLFD